MSEGFDRIVVSFFAGVAGTIVSAFITVGIVGYGFERPEFTPFAALFIGIGILTAWLTYRAKYSNSYDDLCKQYPNGVLDWAVENKILKNYTDGLKRISYKHKVEAVKSETGIVIKEQRIRDEYNKLKTATSNVIFSLYTRKYKNNKYEIVKHKYEIEQAEVRHRKEERAKRLNARYEELSKQYPLGIKVWLSKNNASSVLSYEQLEKVCSEEMLIKDFESHKKKENEQILWKKEQEKFAAHCRQLRNECLDTFGCYSYGLSLNLNGITTKGDYTVWQMFPYSYCNEEDLDYTYFKSIQDNAKRVKNYRASISSELADKIASFIDKLNDEERTSAYFCPVKEGWDQNLYCGIYITIIGGLKDSYSNDLIFDPTDDWSGDVPDFNNWKENVNRRIVIIDVATENNELEKICKDLIEELAPKRPLITFVSVQKCYDRKEMVAIIEREKKKRAEESLKKEKEKKAKEGLIQSVSSWDILAGGLHYSYLFYYYPTKCDFDANEEEWDNRYMVWNFKNDPERHISPQDHENTLEEIIPKIKQKLTYTFGEEYLQFLTLVCLPASTAAKNKARYEEFSQRLCDVTGMENAYNYIHIVKDGMSKKDPRNLTGRSIQPEVSLEDWFSDKYVLLFDDVITKGGTMLRYKSLMEKMGATVVGGLSLGKTKHERPIQGRIPNPFTRPVFPPQPMTTSDPDDLPF